MARVGHWDPDRWTKPARAGRSRADVVFDLVQSLGELSRRAEALPPRPVPRLDNDLALPDQVRVIAADLLVAGASAEDMARAAGWIDATTRAL